MRGVIGNEHAQAVLERALSAGQLRHAYLLHGPEGVGKLTLAMAFAQAALCQRRQPGESEACGECAACRKVAHGNHADLTIVEAEEGKRWVSIDIVRAMEHLASLAPTESDYRIFIFPDMERLQERASNALLKTLEEPPPGVIILLLATEPDALLPTILSRCQLIALRPAPPEQISAALRERWGVAPEAAERLAGLANGRLGWAVRALERPDDQTERERALERIVALVAAPPDERMRIAGELGSDNAAARATLDLWIGWWRDVTLVANGAHALLSAGIARREAERIGPLVGPEGARAFFDALLMALASMDINANPRLTLENLALALPRLRPSGVRR
ncbi:MAG TPA: DNA polymerase III subunit delta' [Ktedonobacterales bacterium]|nr:DNA polymerase III subunit delta' [Ktedonobacterales bacterium]